MSGKSDVFVVCNSPEQWAYLGQGSNTWGYVTFTYSYYTGVSPGKIAWLAPQTCLYLERFWLAGDKRSITKNCVVGETTEYETQAYRVRVNRKVRVKGKWVIRRVWITRYRDVPVQVPMYAECNDYLLGTLFSLQTLAHESIHLIGVRVEADAECFGMQFLRFAATGLGADSALAEEFVQDYYNRYYKVYRPGSEYFRADCVDGGPPDLVPGSSVFPLKAQQ